VLDRDARPRLHTRQEDEREKDTGGRDQAKHQPLRTFVTFLSER
jgi:hypothetical protein